jgi:hypothetical protein
LGAYTLKDAFGPKEGFVGPEHSIKVGGSASDRQATASYAVVQFEQISANSRRKGRGPASTRPRRRAASRPSLVRSAILSRSNCAMDAKAGGDEGVTLTIQVLIGG